jgi:glycosyltransferase involved in cell wall biosynthesis
VKILTAITYYRPYVSGLTNYAQRLAAELARRGHEIILLTSRHDSALRPRETLDGIRVLRHPVLARIGKASIQPGLFARTLGLLRRHDALHLHLPQGEAGPLALAAKLLRKPLFITYHCDLLLPPGALNAAMQWTVHRSNHVAGALADAVVAYTTDFASHSPFLTRWSGKTHVIPPPVEVSAPSEAVVARLRHRWNLEGKKIVGFAARPTAEKGIDILLAAMSILVRKMPGAVLLLAGPQSPVGGSVLGALEAKMASLGDAVRVAGMIDDEHLGSFYALCDVLALPSVNSTESFGLVQAEAMLCGTPAVASDLPGVREVVTSTGMGLIVPRGNAAALAEALAEVIANRDRYVRPAAEIAERYSTARCAARYEELFEQFIRR